MGGAGRAVAARAVGEVDADAALLDGPNGARPAPPRDAAPAFGDEPGPCAALLPGPAPLEAPDAPRAEPVGAPVAAAGAMPTDDDASSEPPTAAPGWLPPGIVG